MKTIFMELNNKKTRFKAAIKLSLILFGIKELIGLVLYLTGLV